MKNYFKAGDKFIFFNDSMIHEVRRAYFHAMRASKNPSIFRLPPQSGPWDSLGIVGYRKREDILSDLNASPTEAIRRNLRAELKMVEYVYFDAGRDYLPVSEAELALIVEEAAE